MPQGPAPANPGRGVPPSGAQPEPDHWQPVITRPDPMPPGEWEALLAASLDEVEPPEDGEEHLDPEGSVLPPDEDLAAIEVEAARFAAERAADTACFAREETAELAGVSAASDARKHGPRGPGLPGSADRVPGMSGGPAGGFGAGQCLDLAPGSASLHVFIETAVDSGHIPAGFVGRNHLTTPLTTLLGLADRPGELHGLGPVDPWQARDLAAASAANPKTTWCLTVTDNQGRAVGHGCARPEPRSRTTNQARPGKQRTRPPPGGTGPPGTTSTGFTITRAGPGPPGGYGTWRFTTGVPGQAAWIITIDPIPAGDCDHRYRAKGHDPGVKLRHLTEVRYATCTGPSCRKPAATCDFEHNVPYEAGGLTCLCNGGPPCQR